MCSPDTRIIRVISRTGKSARFPQRCTLQVFAIGIGGTLARSPEWDNFRNARRWPSRHAPTISPGLHPCQPSFSSSSSSSSSSRRRLASLLTSDRWFTREDLLLAGFYERLWPATETRREQRLPLPRTENHFLRDSAQLRQSSPLYFLGELLFLWSKRNCPLHQQQFAPSTLLERRARELIDSLFLEPTSRLNTSSFGYPIDYTIAYQSIGSIKRV